MGVVVSRPGVSHDPQWARWEADPSRPAWTVGIEEEVMLVDPERWTLAYRLDDVLPVLSSALTKRMSAETHACTLELAGGVHTGVRAAVGELAALRVKLADELGPLGLRAAVAGTHPFAQGEDTEVSGSARYQILYEKMRELARREPTFALHVHVGVPDPELAILAADRLRAHLPLVLAASGNSPYWRGRDSGMASFRTPLFQGFPRSGIPRRFGSYDAYVEAVDVMLRAEIFPEPTFIWWDVRVQPRLGTVEVRIPDAQTTVADATGIAALIQALVRLEATEGYATRELVEAHELLEENRFIAARDGMDARLVDVATASQVPVRVQLEELLAACTPHAEDLGSVAELEQLRALMRSPGYARQREMVQRVGLSGLVESLAMAFVEKVSGTPGPAETAGSHARDSR
jgi:glutamate---cysteine ligase / carboxylate-amine ligase